MDLEKTILEKTLLWVLDPDDPEYPFFQAELKELRNDLVDLDIWNGPKLPSRIRDVILELEQHKKDPDWIGGLYGIGAVPLLLSIIYYFFGLESNIVLYISAAAGILLLGSYLTALLKRVGIAFLLSAAAVLFLTYQFVTSQNTFVLLALVAVGSIVIIMITRIIQLFWDKTQESRLRPYKKAVETVLQTYCEVYMFAFADIIDRHVICLPDPLELLNAGALYEMVLPDPLAEATRKHIIHIANFDNIQYKVEELNGRPHRIIITKVPKE